MSSPRTIIELADYEGFGPERGPAPHKAARVYINGQEVRVAKDGIEVTTSDATRVTLELLPDEVRFVREPQGPSSEQVEANFDEFRADKISGGSFKMSGEPEPKPVVQAGWTLAERERRRQKRRVKKIMISSQPYTLNFDAREISPNLYRTLFGE